MLQATQNLVTVMVKGLSAGSPVFFPLKIQPNLHVQGFTVEVKVVLYFNSHQITRCFLISGQ